MGSFLKTKKIKKNKDRAGRGEGNTKTDIHASIDNGVYDRLYKFRNDQIGRPSYSGIINTALEAFMDERGY